MGNKSAKKTNELLGQQTAQANQIAGTAGGRSQEQYDMLYGNQGKVNNSLWDIYNSVGSNSGGGGGYTKASFGDKLKYDSSSLPFYKQMMESGGYSDTDKGNLLSYATGPITGMYDAVARNMATRAAGGGGGYSSGLSALLRDKAYAAGDMAKGVNSGLLEAINANRFKGAGGVTDVEGSQMGLTERETERERAFNAAERARQQAAANRGRNSANAARDEQRSILNQILGINGDRDLQYQNNQTGASGLASQNINSRVDETPMWQKALAQTASGVAGAAAGAFSGGLSGKMKTPWNQTSEYQAAMTPTKPYTFR